MRTRLPSRHTIMLRTLFAGTSILVGAGAGCGLRPLPDRPDAQVDGQAPNTLGQDSGVDASFEAGPSSLSSSPSGSGVGDSGQGVIFGTGGASGVSGADASLGGSLGAGGGTGVNDGGAGTDAGAGAGGSQIADGGALNAATGGVAAAGGNLSGGSTGGAPGAGGAPSAGGAPGAGGAPSAGGAFGVGGSSTGPWCSKHTNYLFCEDFDGPSWPRSDGLHVDTGCPQVLGLVQSEVEGASSRSLSIPAGWSCSGPYLMATASWPVSGVHSVSLDLWLQVTGHGTGDWPQYAVVQFDNAANAEFAVGIDSTEKAASDHLPALLAFYWRDGTHTGASAIVRNYVQKTYYHLRLEIDLDARRATTSGSMTSSSSTPGDDLTWKAEDVPFSPSEITNVNLRVGLNSGLTADGVMIDNVLFDIR